jgi:NADH-quinone oxidoreductase subunit I
VTERRTRKQYWNEPKLGLWERAYIFEIVRGLSITGRVFCSNMWKWVTGRKGALTAYYPEETRADYSPSNRGRHVLTQRPDGKVQCVACNLCATVCPAYCIEIEAAADFADTAHPKSPLRFEIDYSRCIFCGFCVEACPEDAIRMVKETPNLPGFDRDAMWGRKDLLMQWHPLKDPRKPYPADPATAKAAAP